MKLERLPNSDIELILARLNAIHLDSHFIYSSGKHGAHYIAKDTVGLDPRISHHLGHELACRLHEAEFFGFEDQIRTVVGAPMGAIRLADHVAYWLKELFGMEIQSIYAEKNGDDAMIIRPAFHDVVRRGDTLLYRRHHQRW